MSRISDKTRPAKAGRQLAQALIEVTHILYLNDNALEFLQGVCIPLNIEYHRRINEWSLRTVEKEVKKMKSSGRHRSKGRLAR